MIARSPRRLPRSVRTFIAGADGAYHESPWIPASLGPGRGVALVDRDGRTTLLPPLPEWSVVARPPASPPAAPTVEVECPLRLVHAEDDAPWAGVLLRSSDVDEWERALAPLPAPDRRSIRTGRAGALCWIYAAHGLRADGDPIRRDGRPGGSRSAKNSSGRPRARLPGRGLRNLGSFVEPVLVPVARRPEPPLATDSLRRVFGLEEGDGLVWWDRGERESTLRFRRSETERWPPRDGRSEETP